MGGAVTGRDGLAGGARRAAATAIAALMATLVLVAGLPAQASAASCTYTRTADGFPVWSGCSTTVAPGRFGPLRMGRTTVGDAKDKKYLAYNRLCGGWYGVQAGPDWRKKQGVLVWWRGGTVTSKGLRPRDSLRKARSLYPNLKRTGYFANAYVPGQGWKVHSVRTSRGWLDWYRYTTDDRRFNFFAVRALSVSRPQGFAQDGC